MTLCFECHNTIEGKVERFAIVTGYVKVPVCKECYREGVKRLRDEVNK